MNRPTQPSLTARTGGGEPSHWQVPPVIDFGGYRSPPQRRADYLEPFPPGRDPNWSRASDSPEMSPFLLSTPGTCESPCHFQSMCVSPPESIRSRDIGDPLNRGLANKGRSVTAVTAVTRSDIEARRTVKWPLCRVSVGR